MLRLMSQRVKEPQPKPPSQVSSIFSMQPAHGASKDEPLLSHAPVWDMVGSPNHLEGEMSFHSISSLICSKFAYKTLQTLRSYSLQGQVRSRQIL